MSEGKENYLAPASFITAQGTPVIMAFKKDCAWDTGKAMRSIQDSGCIAYMYDESGTRLPNKLGKDWVQHGLTIASIPIATINGYKIIAQAFQQNVNGGLSKSKCKEEASKNYAKISCENNYDLWAYAMKYCHEKGGRIPNEQEMILIIQGLYYNVNTNKHDLNTTSWDKNEYKPDLELWLKVFGKTPDNNSYPVFWTSVETSSVSAMGVDNAYYNFIRTYAPSGISKTNNYYTYGICIE